MPFFRPIDGRVQRLISTCAVGLLSEHGRARVAVRVGEAIASRCGLEIGTRVEVLWGHGVDFGRICICQDQRGVRLVSRGKGGRTLFTTAKAPFGSDIADAEGAVWRLIRTRRAMTPVRTLDLPNGRLGLELPQEWFECVRPARKAAAFRAA